jgi:hypothetical protein
MKNKQVEYIILIGFRVVWAGKKVVIFKIVEITV